MDLYYNIKIEALFMYEDACYDCEEYELAETTQGLNKIIQEQYECFRLKNYDSEYKCFIRDKVYFGILGYNPERK